MIFTITLHKEIEIPDAQLLRLANLVREKWSMDDDAEVHAEDLLNEACTEGLINLPDNWQAPDKMFGNDELKPRTKRIGTKRKRA